MEALIRTLKNLLKKFYAADDVDYKQKLFLL